jgi:glycosyltransferase involved in cell wall biosynthesis
VELAKHFDVIHTTTYNAALPAWIAAKWNRKKSVITIHEIFEKKWFKYQNYLYAILFYIIEKIVISLKFNYHVAVSNSSLNQYKKIYPNRKSVCVYNGVNYEKLNQNIYDRNQIRKFLRWDKKFILFSYGRPAISKGFITLVNALPSILEKIPQSRFIFVWSDDQNSISIRQKLLNRIGQLGLEKYCEIYSSLNDDTLFEMIVGSDCVVIPSLSEGFGYAVVESCTLGAKVVASDTTSIPEVVSGMYRLVKPGNSFDIYEAVIEIERNNIIKVDIKYFYIEDMIRQYHSIYKSLLS